MNESMRNEIALEKSLVARLEDLLGSVPWLRGCRVEHQDRVVDRGYNILATVPLPEGGKAILCVLSKGELRPVMFRTIADRRFSPPGRPKVVVPVLALPWMSPRMAELCAENEWSWFDLAGNCTVNIPGVLSLQRLGNKPVHKVRQRTANYGTSEAGRVLLALLHPEHAGLIWTQRELQIQSGQAVPSIPQPSLGLVNKVVRSLRDDALVEATDSGNFRVSNPLALLQTWRDAYRFNRHDRRGYFTLFQGQKLRAALSEFASMASSVALYAAFSAADVQAPSVRQAKTWVYINEEDLPLFEEHLGAKSVDSGENLVILVPADGGVFYRSDNGGDHRPPCTNLIQTYVDCYHAGSRGEEAAEALLKQRIKPVWKQLGLIA